MDEHLKDIAVPLFWIYLKNKTICMEKFVGEQDLGN